MAKIKAFSALRFSADAGKISELVCPPYDIVSEEERLALIERNHHNLIRLELPKGDEPYKTAAKILTEWLGEGAVRCDDKEGIYIYEELFSVDGKSYSLKGFISLVRLEEFSKGIILPHEETLSKAKTDRFNLMTETGCSFSQIYSLYMDEKKNVSAKIAELSSSDPEISFKDADGITHNLWCVYDKNDIADITAMMADKKLYIADGHHRYETALNFARANSKDVDDDSERTNYCMMMLVNMESDGLVVFPTHRIIHSLENFNSSDMLKRCKDYFDLKQGLSKDSVQEELAAAAKAGKKSFGFYDGKDFCLMTLKDDLVMNKLLPDKSDAYRSLDVSVLHSLVLERLFGIDRENMANQKNLRYTRSADEAISAVDNGEANCSFIINPTLVTQIRDVAAAGEKMPQKSTYFYPKIITGLVMNKFREPKQ